MYALTLSIAAAGRAARIEQDWEDAVKKAIVTHAFNERMVCGFRLEHSSRLTFPRTN
jgi:hypothetical protein